MLISLILLSFALLLGLTNISLMTMPSWSYHAACMDLMFCHEEVLINSSAWFEMTKESAMPYCEDGIPDLWDLKMVQSVVTLQDHLVSLPNKEHLKFLLTNNWDNFTAGHELIGQWLNKHFHMVWRIKQRVLQCLEENELGPYDQIRAHSKEEVSRLVYGQWHVPLNDVNA